MSAWTKEILRVSGNQSTLLILYTDFSISQRLSGKEFACHVGDTGDTGSIPGLGRSPGEEMATLLQNSCLENPMDRGAWWAPVHGVTED